MNKPIVYTANTVFTGHEWLSNIAMTVVNGVIENIEPIDEIRNDVHQHFTTIVPAFIDLQIYGAAGKLFSAFADVDALEKLHQHCLQGGTAFFLPTIATSPLATIHACIDAVKSYWQNGGQGCLGLHVEGPWINIEKAGAHVKELIHAPSLDEVKELLQYGEGVIKMITLAPEICDPAIIAYIQSKGIVVSAGHSNASYTQAKKAFENGVNTVTHLYNAMSGLQHREPGLVGATFTNSTVFAGIIPDGVHVDFAAVQIAYKQMQGRLFAITDAVTETNIGFYKHHAKDGYYENDGTLSGSSLTMTQAVKNLVNHCNVPLDEAFRMASLYPAKVMGLDDSLGCLKPGYKASFCSFDLYI